VAILIKVGNGMIIFRNIIILFLVSNLLYGELNTKESNMKSNWEKLFTYWADKNAKFWHDDKPVIFTKNTTCKGATIAELKEIENYYKVIPSKLIESLTICNESNRWFGFNSWGLLYGTEEMLKVSRSFENSPINSNGSYDNIVGKIRNPDILMPKEWIPIYDWNTDYRVVIDMLSENKGQIIVVFLEDGTLAKWTDSYEEWFELAIDEVLKYGELRVETIEAVFESE